MVRSLSWQKLEINLRTENSKVLGEKYIVFLGKLGLTASDTVDIQK